jgi:acetoin utilization deacetylase AcuC-like enzyme
MSELLMVEQRRGRTPLDGSHWIREGGRLIEGQDSNRRLAALRSGLLCHGGVRAVAADAADEQVEEALEALHDADYLTALREVSPERPVVLHRMAAPGLEPDIPVSAGLVDAAHEAVRTAIAAAERVAGGARFSYAVCRPPGHHAGPSFCGGYCYFNNAAAAVRTLREAGLGPVGILDLDLHYPNGTSVLVEEMDGAALHSLHAAPVTNVPPDTVLPRAEGERAVAFAGSPDAATYLEEVAASVQALAAEAAALVVSLGYDTVAGDPHGSWDFAPEIFAEVGRILAAPGLPVCVIQEGGYSLSVLAACSYAFAAGLLEESPPERDRGFSRIADERSAAPEVTP